MIMPTCSSSALLLRAAAQAVGITVVLVFHLQNHSDLVHFRLDHLAQQTKANPIHLDSVW
nr:unnamed protein product [Digitaria exilis]